MPKVFLPPLPLSALFAVAKPSGPSSMAIINDIKLLASASSLFVDKKSAILNAAALYEAEGSKNDAKHARGHKKPRRKHKGRVFEVKIGQGGTLDPLADGVLVVGIGKGTKKLSELLDCTKEYRTTGLLGSETDSYDSEGAEVRAAPWRHVTRDALEAALPRFRGEILQTPPIFSALKMDGKPLYEYARSGTPLPRAIAKRAVTVHALALRRFIRGGEHPYKPPERKFSDEERAALERSLRGVEGGAELTDAPDPALVSGATTTKEGAESTVPGVDAGPPAFELEMRVSGGTYVRSIVHDLGHAVGSAAHVVTLTRSRQGRFVLEAPTGVDMSEAATGTSTTALLTGAEDGAPPSDALGADASAGDAASVKPDETLLHCVPWAVFERALAAAGRSPSGGAATASEAESTSLTEDAAKEEVDEEGWRPWERAVIEAMEVVEVK